MSDPLWETFAAIWPVITASAVENNQVLVAGGYGLFLKHRWLAETASPRNAVPLGEWLDTEPRATRDIDLVLSLDLIADADRQGNIGTAIRGCGFLPYTPRWRYKKTIDPDRHILLEFHALPPPPGDGRFTFEDRRVKGSSDHPDRLHGHDNAEAIGSNLWPTPIILDGLRITVPNPVTWAIMKLVSTRDRWQKHQASFPGSEDSKFEYLQAEKHARDVFRIVAMTTRDEDETSMAVVTAINGSQPYTIARQVWRQAFASAGYASPFVDGRWNPESAATIRGILDRWFP